MNYQTQKMSKEELKIIINAVDEASATLQDVAKEIEGVEKESKKTATQSQKHFNGFLGFLKGAFVAGIVGVVAGIGAIGVASLDVAGQANQAQREIQGELGVTEAQAESLADTALEVFGNNFGESVIDAKNGIVEIRQQLGNLADDELQRVTENAFKLSDAFDVDIRESTNAVKALMQEFGLTAEEAQSMIASGFQKGLNSSDDFLDSIREYSNQFSEGGASADEFFNIMASGLGTGVLGTDKAGDLFKEFVVRIQDGSKLTAKSLDMIGINSDQMLRDLANGTKEPIDAFNEVQKALKATDDEARLMQAGVGLLGTQFEDLGASTVLAIDASTQAWDKEGESLAQINKRYESFGALASGAWRQVLVALEPVSGALLDFANELLPYLIEGIEWLTDTLTEMGENPAFQQFVKDTWQGLMNSFQFFADEILPFLVQRFNEFMVFFETELLPLIKSVWTIIATEILPLIFPIMRDVMAIIQALWPVVSFILSQVWTQFKTIINLIVNLLKNFLQILGGVMKIIAGFLTGDMSMIAEGFTQVWQGMADGVKTIFDGIIESVKNGVNGAVDVINNLIDKIPDKAGFFKPPKIPRFAKGGSFMTDGPMLMVVGDNPGGREQVDITPVSSPNINGPKENDKGGGGINIVFNFPNKPMMFNAESIDEFIKIIKPKLEKELN